MRIVCEKMDDEFLGYISWHRDTKESDIYKYVTDYNNQIKHIESIDMLLQTRMADLSSQINNVSFEKHYRNKTNPHQKEDGLLLMEKIIREIKSSYELIVLVIKEHLRI